MKDLERASSEDGAPGFRVQVWVLGFEVWGLGFRVYGLWFRVYGLGFRVQGSGLGGVAGLRQRVEGFRLDEGC